MSKLPIQHGGAEAPAFRRHLIALAVISVFSAPVMANPGDCDEGADSTALECGEGSVATQPGATALGYQNVASGVNATAVGSGNVASGANSIAVGSGNVATGVNAIMIGSGNGSTNPGTAHNNIVIGINNVAGRNNNDGVSGSVIVGRDNTGNTNATNSRSNDEIIFGIGNSVNNNGSGGFAERGSTALGYFNIADSRSNSGAGLNPNIAVGSHNRSVSGGSTGRQNQSAVGTWNDAAGAGASAMGNRNSVIGNASSAFGSNNVIGVWSTVDEGNGVDAYGYALDGDGLRSQAGAAAAHQSLAVGEGNLITAAGAAALGRQNEVSGAFATALGNQNTASGARSVAIGSTADASGDDSLALGTSAEAQAANSVALGTGSIADVANTISVGNAGLQRRIVNMAAGVADTDGVNVSQLQHLGLEMSTTFGGGASYDASTGSFTGPVYQIDGTDYFNIADALQAAASGGGGGSPLALQYDDATLGSVTLGGAGGTRIGNLADGVADDDAVNVGQLNAAVDGVAGDVAALADDALLFDGTTYNAARGGDPTRVSGVANAVDTHDAVNLGQVGQLADALGGGASYDGDGNLIAPNYVIAGGSYNNVGDAFEAVDDEIAGLNLQVSGLLGDALLWNGTDAYDASRGGVASRITGVAAGAVAAGSTDAINGGQLHGHASSVAGALGGGSTVDGDGNITAPSYNVAGGSQGNVGDALTAIDNRVSDEIAALGDAAVQYDDASKGTVTFEGADGTVLTNVAAGEISETSTDAVNGAQLHETNQQVAQNTADIAALDDRVTNIEGDVVNLDNRVTDIEGDLVATNDRIDGLDQDLSDLDNRLSGEIGDLSDDLADLAAGNTGFCRNGETGNSVVCGDGAEASIAAENAVAIGSNARADESGGVAIGNQAHAVSTGSVAIGDGAVAQSSVAIGTGAQATGLNSTAVGDNAVASGSEAVALGNEAQATHDNSVALGAGSSTDRDNSVSVGSAGNERQITHVAAGTEDTDAVNVSQLRDANMEILNQANEYTDMRVEGLRADFEAFQGDINARIDRQGRRINSVGALSAALTMAMPDPRVRGDSQFSMGIGHYRDTEALSASFSHLIAPNRAVRMGGAVTGTGENMIGAGVTIGW